VEPAQQLVGDSMKHLMFGLKTNAHFKAQQAAAVALDANKMKIAETVIDLISYNCKILMNILYD
jgi:hypothetical protein